MMDLTKTHSEQFVDENGKKHVVIKPINVERTVHPDGRVDVTITVPRVSMKPKVKQS